MKMKRKQVGGSNADVVKKLCPKTQVAEKEHPEKEFSRVATILGTSPVIRQVPFQVRSRLERLLFERVSNSESTQAIAEELELEKHGISVADLQSYRDALDELIRPVASVQVIAGVLGCLPEKYRRRLMMGNQVLLLSKVAKALADTQKEDFAAGELLKLASVLRAAALTQERGRKPVPGSRADKKAGPDLLDFGIMTRAVRTLYGMIWPLPVRQGA